jgi:hypothetical protein
MRHFHASAGSLSNTKTNPKTIKVLFSQYTIYSLRIRLHVSAVKLYPSPDLNLLDKKGSFHL